jgi:hypothetical protein
MESHLELMTSARANSNAIAPARGRAWVRALLSVLDTRTASLYELIDRGAKVHFPDWWIPYGIPAIVAPTLPGTQCLLIAPVAVVVTHQDSPERHHMPSRAP